MVTDIKHECTRREAGGWDKIEWKLRGFEDDTPRVVRRRMLYPNVQGHAMSFVQITVHTPPRQSYAAYAKRGNLVAGDPDKVSSVDDLWVFVHSFGVPNAR
mmetsp:Transcript_16495/g.40394  ORF Transcript_16495/g.40394 Transcript_16495/m.40394 type:complete len:101 (+) Transcript_16495:61-363(+)